MVLGLFMIVCGSGSEQCEDMSWRRRLQCCRWNSMGEVGGLQVRMLTGMCTPRPARMRFCLRTRTLLGTELEAIPVTPHK